MTTALPSLDLEEDIVIHQALLTALSRLPRRQREAVALRYLADMSEVEVAHTLGISRGSVKTHVHRGLQSLRPEVLHLFTEPEGAAQ
ncbi:MAG: sigma-70 family RNA polymerase sigma factor [Acidimicrobiales bacterium]